MRHPDIILHNYLFKRMWAGQHSCCCCYYNCYQYHYHSFKSTVKTCFLFLFLIFSYFVQSLQCFALYILNPSVCPPPKKVDRPPTSNKKINLPGWIYSNRFTLPNRNEKFWLSTTATTPYLRKSLCCKIASWLTFAAMSPLASTKAISSSVVMRAGW